MKRTLLALALLFFVCAADPAGAKTIKIVAGTEMIADIVRDLTGGKAEILPLVPAASCPGHHDVRASDIAFIKNADAIILHTWQEKQKHIADAIATASPAVPPHYVGPAPSWLVPANQMDGSGAIYGVLNKTSGSDFKTLTLQYNARLMRIVKVSGKYHGLITPYKNTPVMASAMQADFAASLGMKVVARYGRAEDTAPAGLMKLVKQGKEAGVTIVIDNLQSGAEAGQPLAGELGAAHIVFSNFPRFTPDVPTYEDLYSYNCELLLAALRNRSGK